MSDNIMKVAHDTPYISTQSERYAAYAAGLGTFGLSKGLITKKGIAGRFVSVITNAEFNADIRPYSGPFEYCAMCGTYMTGSKLPPHGANRRIRYGCGKCQCGVHVKALFPKYNF